MRLFWVLSGQAGAVGVRRRQRVCRGEEGEQQGQVLAVRKIQLQPWVVARRGKAHCQATCKAPQYHPSRQEQATPQHLSGRQAGAGSPSAPSQQADRGR